MNELSTRLRAALQSPTFASARKSVFFHPSSASITVPAPWGGTKVVGACLRQQYYRLLDEAPSNLGEPDHSISAMLGDKASQLLVELIDLHGFTMGLQRLAAEHSFFDPRTNVSGRSDIIVWDSKIQEVVGIEVKSVGEYKAGKAIERPCEEHVMQAMLYLDYYRTFIPEGQKRPTRWYIWYISRTENWTVKSGKHGSPMAMLWDYSITLNDEGVPTIHAAGGMELWKDFSVSKIHQRFSDLDGYIRSKTLPPQDYEISYSPEKITSLYKADLFTRKADKEAMEKWLAKGAPEGKLKVAMGDFECQLCPYKDKCWMLSSNNYPQVIANLPKMGTAMPAKSAVDDIF